ncbi:MAG: 4Fe-4S ferredoxin [Nitrospirae bacterium]|nr:MAG: 4Fe-4S ferredoxin [Nitrospirota bacterium]
MSIYYIYQNMERCIGCHACELHCKTEHDVPLGPQLGKIIGVGPRIIDNIPRINFVFLSCFHCEKPWCIGICPTGAMKKRQKDGIVFVDEELCVGCKACIKACPWGMPQWNDETGKVMKCDYCRHRIDEGLEPACVAGCTTKALFWITPHEASRLKREKIAKEIAEYYMHF